MINYDAYVDSIKSLDEFKKLKEFKNIIDKKYPNLIINLKTKEALYLDAKRMENYFPDFDKVKKDFMDAKALLYSKEEVKEYFKYERMLQKILNDDMDMLKASISNKFSMTNDFFNKF